MKITHIVVRINKKIIVFLMCLMGLGSISMYSQSCSSDLSVEKNRNTKSATEDGAIFRMVLSNNSSTHATYSFAATNISERCSNDSDIMGAFQGNVSLNVAFLHGNSGSETQGSVSLSPGKTYEFIVKVTAPIGTEYGRWGCIKVDAIPNNCTSTSTILKIYVPDPSQG